MTKIEVILNGAVVHTEELNGESRKDLKVKVTGNMNSADSSLSVNIHGDVVGDVNAGMGVTAGNVTGNIDAGMDVHCGSVGGDVRTGMGVKCGPVSGNVKAGMGISITNG